MKENTAKALTAEQCREILSAQITMYEEDIKSAVDCTSKYELSRELVMLVNTYISIFCRSEIA